MCRPATHAVSVQAQADFVFFRRPHIFSPRQGVGGRKPRAWLRHTPYLGGIGRLKNILGRVGLDPPFQAAFDEGV